MPREQDHYQALDLPRTASSAEIKRRYRQLMREFHPDANRNDPQANRRAARINLAYETLGDTERRRSYDASLPAPARTRSSRRNDKIYAHWAQQENWEDIVAENVPPARPAHRHSPEPSLEPREIDVTLEELEGARRVKRRITITNPCACTLKGEVATSEPWLWGPLGKFEVPPGATLEFDVELISSRVRFPGLSRVLFVTPTWTGTVPVRVHGWRARPRRVLPATNASYVRGNARTKRWGRVPR